MSNTLENLRKLAASSNITPYTDDNDTPYNSHIKERKKKTSKIIDRDDSEESLESFLNGLDEKLSNMGVLSSDDFDALMDSVDIDDEDTELKTALAGMGRKYARDHAVSEGASEIDKAFAANEQMLRNILDEVNKDAVKIEHDLEVMRGSSFGRNAMKTAELASTKKGLHDTRLAFIKELDNITIKKFELKTKLEKDTGANDNSGIANNIMQQIFGMGRGAIIDDNENENDYHEPSNVDDDNSMVINSGEQFCDEYDKQKEMSEGDMYLKYEGRDIKVIAEFPSGSNECVGIYAEDEDGNRIDDYPVPSDPSQLNFEINERAGVATDHLQRTYVYREI